MFEYQGLTKTENELLFALKSTTIFLSWCRMVTRHSAFFVPVFEVELQGFISISVKRRIWKVGILEGWNPSKFPKFSVWRFLGTREFAKLQVLYLQNIFWKISLFFLFLQWVQRRILFCEPSSFEYFLWQSKSYKVIRDFCFQHRCTPENRYCGVTDCHFWFLSQAVILSSYLELNSILDEDFSILIGR